MQATGQTQHRHILFMAGTTTLCVWVGGHVCVQEHVWGRGRGRGARLPDKGTWEAERRREGEVDWERQGGWVNMGKNFHASTG